MKNGIRHCLLVAVVLLIAVLVSACSVPTQAPSPSKTVGIDNTASTGGETDQDDITNDEPFDPDKEMIEGFYNAVFAIYDASLNYEDGTLYTTTSNHIEKIHAFLEYAVAEGSEYSTYFNEMRDNVFVECLCTIYSRYSVSDMDFGAEVIAAAIFERCSKNILDITLPFESETQLTYDTQKNASDAEKNESAESKHDLSEIDEKVLVQATDLNKAGTTIIYSHSGKTYSTDSSDVYTNFGSFSISATLTLYDSACVFQLNIPCTDWCKEEIRKISVNGAEFFSTQMKQLGSVVSGSYFCSVHMFSSDNDPSMNETFYRFQTTMQEATTIEIIINDSYSFVLDEEQTKDVKVLLSLTDYATTFYM